MKNNLEPKQRFTGYFIPVEIMEIKELSLLEKLVLSLIDSLYCKEHGGCFASNEYIANKFNVKENTIAKTISNLRKLNFIEDVSFDGRIRVIRSLMFLHVDKAQSNGGLDKNPSRVGKKSNPKLEKNPTPSLYSYNKGYRKERRGGKPPAPDGAPPSPSSFSKDEKKIERAPHVATSEKDHTKLIEDYGEELVQEAYDRLSLWKIDTPKSKWKKHDHLALRRWAIAAVKDDRKKNGKPEIIQQKRMELFEKNKKWMEKLLKRIHFIDYKYSIEAKETGIMIREDNSYIPVGYTEENFQKIVESRLKQWRIQT